MTILNIHSIAEHWKLIVMIIIIAIAIFFVIAEVFGLFHHNSKSPILKFIKHKETSVILSLLVSVSIMTIIIDGQLERLTEKTERIENLSTKIDNKVKLVEELKNIKSDFDPVLNSIFSVDMDEKISFFDQAVNEKRYEIKDINKFQEAYAKTFEMFPSSHILATSLLDSSYFWSATGEPYRPMELKMKDFLAKGGKMTRIFYIDDKIMTLPRSEKVLERQMEMGVDVFTVQKANTNKQLFVLYENKDFGWIVQVDPDDKKITTFKFTRNEEDLKKFKEEFDKLSNNSTCIKCRRK